MVELEQQKETSHVWTTRNIIFSTLTGLVLLTVSLIINYFAGTYATANAGNSVKDIILDHLPVFNVDIIYADGIIVFFLFVIFLLIHNHRRAPFILKSLSLFILIRSFFVILTHVGPSPLSLAYAIPSSMDQFTFQGDLFFSGHTGFPFLMALIFWQQKNLRRIFIFLSIIFGITVLLGHFHYSIDVFSAFFITFGIYHIAIKIFKKDYHLLESTFHKSK